MACAALCAACSGVGGDPLDDGGSAIDAAEDHKVGVTLDGGADAATNDAAVCPFEDANSNALHAQCEPVVDGVCASACGRENHYSCINGSNPPPELGCLSIGNGDYCCAKVDCVLDQPPQGVLNCNCQSAPNGETIPIACPPGLGPWQDSGAYGGHAQGTYSSCYVDVDSGGVSHWCVN